MPGSGKSFWSKKIADHFSIPHFDLDDIISKKMGSSIERIFEEKGEDYFRKIESECLTDLIKLEKSIYVLATGGGTPCYNRNDVILNQNTLSIFLDVRIPFLIKNLKTNKEERPLLKGVYDLEEHLKRLLETRNSSYQKAQKNIESPITIEKLNALISKSLS
jgi:shikimate kinase